MVVSSSIVRLVLIYLLCTCCQHQHHAALLASNTTSSHSATTTVHARGDNITDTTVTLDRAPPPLLWSQAKTTWPAIDGVSWSTLPKHKGGAGVGGFFTVHDASRCSSRADNCTDRVRVEGSAAAFSVSGNRSATQAPSRRRLQEVRGVHRRREKKSGRAPSEGGKRGLLCSFHRTASLHRGCVDCIGVVVVAVVGSALLLLLCSVAGTVLLLQCVQRSHRQGERHSCPAVDPESHDNKDEPALPSELLRRRAAEPRPFSYRELAAATGDFAESRRIGRGGCGAVYRGYLAEQDRHVAVKMFSVAEKRGSREFDAEVEVMSQLRHRNVVRLVGWCDDGRKGRLLLAYELAPGGSLDRSLHCPAERLLTWPERYRIALGVGSAILYLHAECEQCVVHGDIKPSNIMLDSCCNAKLGDFGLARLVDHGAEPDTTRVVAGTVGYVEPEFVGDQRRCPESDVYSFGVVLLEIACGERPAAPPGSGRPPKKETAMLLLNRVRDMYDRNAVLDAADDRLDGAFDERQMERVLVTGLWCAHRDRSRRPSIEEAMAVLRSERSELPVLPAAAPFGGLGQISAFEERAYGDLSTEDETTLSSDSTAYLSPQDSGELLAEE